MNGPNPTRTELPQAERQALMQKVSAVLKAGGMLTESAIDTEVAYFFNDLGLSDFYFVMWTPEVIASHVQAYIGGKKLALMSDPDLGLLSVEVIYPKQTGAIFMCAANEERQNATESRIENYIRTHSDPAYGYSLASFRSKSPGVKQGKVHVLFYFLTWSQWQTPGEMGSDVPPKAISDVATTWFMQSKRPHVQEWYFKALTDYQTSLLPVINTYACDTFRNKPGDTEVLLMASSKEHGTMIHEASGVAYDLNTSFDHRYVESFKNGVEVSTLYVSSLAPETKQRIKEELAATALVPAAGTSPGGDLIRKMYLNGEIDARQAIYMNSLMLFTFYFGKPSLSSAEYHQLAAVLKDDYINLSRLDGIMASALRPTLTEVRIVAAMTAYPELMKELYEDFRARIKMPDFNDESVEALLAKVRRRVREDLDLKLLSTFVAFNASIAKTNFDKPNAAACAYRLDTKRIHKFITFPFREVPHGVFLVTGAHFRGFHVRFLDIARGGIRIIRSRDEASYTANARGLLEENLGLAYTQQAKNAVIPEGGSKGTILLSPKYAGQLKPIFDKYAASILDLILTPGFAENRVVDRLKETEVLFFGPDENTADFMTPAAQYAKTRGYAYWKGFTTGKAPSFGGIPHDEYGMTTNSVRVYAECILEKLGIEQSKTTKFQTGGPDGDLGSNEILMSTDITVGVVDADGVAFDPKGLNRQELTRLAKEKKTIVHFDKKFLGPQGFLVKCSDENVKLPDGTIVEQGTAFRNNFHVNPLVQTDFFVPCGGRPRAINSENVQQLLVDAKGNPCLKYKWIVEGANLFITDDARYVLEKAGVIIFKDASANKGGVTSSSFEVLAGLAMSDEEFQKHMCVKDPNNKPEFYKKYVKDIVARVRSNARREFEVLWGEYKKGSKFTISQMSSILANKINSVFARVVSSELADLNSPLAKAILVQFLPPTLLETVGLETIIKRVPPNYLKAIVGCQLASSYVFDSGLNADELAFFNYLQSILQKAK